MSSETLAVTRARKGRAAGCSARVVGLLKRLGVPAQMLYVRRLGRNASFWLRPINHLAVLEQARNLYRRQIATVHPDKPGGCLERAVELNRIWDEIERRFRDRGHELW
jgi:hypothetical protein